MPEPTTVNKGLIVPNTGDLPGTWGESAINPDMQALDGILGGVVTIVLGSGTTTLTTPSGFTATPSPGPTESQNAMLTFTGTLVGVVTVVFPMPGLYIVNNLCTVGSYYVALQTLDPGNVICAPPGVPTQVFSDGINMHYVNLGQVGSYMDLAATSVPAWISNCTVPPLLNCNGSTFSQTTYPTLYNYLGGNTLPDLRGRFRAALNQGTSRMTTSSGGVDGNTLLAAGGYDANAISIYNLPSYNLTVVIPGGQGSHSHTYQRGQPGVQKPTSGGTSPFDSYSTQSTSNATLPQMSGYAISGGSGTPFRIMNPTTVAGITLIRAG